MTPGNCAGNRARPSHTPSAIRSGFWGFREWYASLPLATPRDLVYIGPGRILTPPQLKKALLGAGFEVFRTLPDEVVLAERVRENLILDSGIRVRAAGEAAWAIKVVLRAEGHDFPGDDEAELFARVRRLAEPVVGAGFAEVGTKVVPMKDPSDEERTLDTFYEVILERSVHGGLDALSMAIRQAFSFEKAASK